MGNKSIHPCACLTDEEMACWQAGLVPAEQEAGIADHLQVCARCRELAKTLADVTVQQARVAPKVTPSILVERACALRSDNAPERIMDAVVTIVDGIYRSVETTGHLLFAPWMSSGVVFRSGETAGGTTIVIEAFRKSLRCRLELSRQTDGHHCVSAVYHDGAADRPLEGQCVLFSNGQEIASRPLETGRTIFEDLSPGSYRLELNSQGACKQSLTFSLVSA